eukprot:Clim_evm3s91 gene=Clim_evmTU3s91
MSFKKIILTGLIAVVAANPVPSAKDFNSSVMGQAIAAISGTPDIVSGMPDIGAALVDEDRLFIYIGHQPRYQCGQKASSLSEQGVRCALYYIDSSDNNELMYVENNPEHLHGSIKSGDFEWNLTLENREDNDLQWITEESMEINEANTFEFSFGATGRNPAIHAKGVSYLDSTVAFDPYPYGGTRTTMYYFGPTKFDDTYDLICVYRSVPQCD